MLLKGFAGDGEIDPGKGCRFGASVLRMGLTWAKGGVFGWSSSLATICALLDGIERW